MNNGGLNIQYICPISKQKPHRRLSRRRYKQYLNDKQTMMIIAAIKYREIPYGILGLKESSQGRSNVEEIQDEAQP